MLSLILCVWLLVGAAIADDKGMSYASNYANVVVCFAGPLLYSKKVQQLINDVYDSGSIQD
jgi:hypothetical protein